VSIELLCLCVLCASPSAIMGVFVGIFPL
jgi:hypothetical protein